MRKIGRLRLVLLKPVGKVFQVKMAILTRYLSRSRWGILGGVEHFSCRSKAGHPGRETALSDGW